MALAALLIASQALAAPDVAMGEGRVIVKYRAAASRDASASKLVWPATLEAKLDGLSKRRGLVLHARRALSAQAHVVTAAGLSSAELARRLGTDADVEYAVPDRRMKRNAVPNDSLFASVVGGEGPDVGQWYLKAPAGEVRSSIDAVSAWDVTTGSANVVVAVLDTGVRFDHPDLAAASAGGKLLPGYDFVRAGISNDGDGLDADASDPGDWVTQADIDGGVVSRTECEVSDSSWHGTQVAGILAALSNNGAGMAGTSWNSRVLPVRVLGKCGGYQSEIIAAMRWAVGLSVPDVPVNPTPARVLNLSLGGPGACDVAYQGAIDEVIAAGGVIVASAGNTVGHSVGAPANCNGVIGVGGLRHIGTKVGFSDVGAGIAISAPGGNCVNTVGACLYPILTTSDGGRQGPAAPVYTDGRNASVGTSFSAPMVAGVAALMLSVQPQLTPAQIADLLQGGARPFPKSGAPSGTARCTAPQFDAAGEPVNQSECYCTTATCGAGMLDAPTAVRSAGAGVVARIDLGGVAPRATEAIALQALITPLISGGNAASLSWSIVDAGDIATGFSGPSDGPTATLTPSAAGTLTVAVTVTDNNGGVSITSKRIDVGAAPVAPLSTDPAAPASGDGGGALSVGYLVALLAAVIAAFRARRERS